MSSAIGGFYLYQHRNSGLPAGLAAGNGRLEAIEVDVATKIAGRVADLAWGRLGRGWGGSGASRCR